jgi:hypothetical protein
LQRAKRKTFRVNFEFPEIYKSLLWWVCNRGGSGKEEPKKKQSSSKKKRIFISSFLRSLMLISSKTALASLLRLRFSPSLPTSLALAAMSTRSRQQVAAQQREQQPAANGNGTAMNGNGAGGGAVAVADASSLPSSSTPSAAATSTTTTPPPTAPLSVVVTDAVKRWYQDAEREAARGDVKQQALLAQMLTEGYGCHADLEAAKGWADKAKRRGYRMRGVYCSI